MNLRIQVLYQQFSVLKLASQPDLRLLENSIFAFSSTQRELTLICESGVAAQILATNSSDGWRAFYLDGSFDFATSGVLLSALKPISSAGIGVMAISTFDSDLILVKAEELNRAARELSLAGHQVFYE